MLRKEDFGSIHKVPVGDTPYARAKHLQLVEKDPEAAIALFWAAINAGDRVESSLKDMAVVMKQLGRPLQAIEAIKSFRHRCSLQAQESLDNVLFDLYKKCGRVDEQIVVLKEKLRLIQHGLVFNGNPTKTARSHGRKFQLSVKQETGRLLSNLGWAYMEQLNFAAAEVVYRKAQYFDADGNKACNLGVCLIKQGKTEEAVEVLEGVNSMDKTDLRSLNRANHLLKEIQDISAPCSTFSSHNNVTDGLEYHQTSRHCLLSSPSGLKKLLAGCDDFLPWEKEDGLPTVEWVAELDYKIARKRHRRLPVFEEITPFNDSSH